MCLAIPGKIIKIKGNEAVVQYPKEKRKANLIEKNFKVGDYVYVSSKIVVQKIPKKEALQCLKLFKQ